MRSEGGGTSYINEIFTRAWEEVGLSTEGVRVQGRTQEVAIAVTEMPGPTWRTWRTRLSEGGSGG